MLIPYISFAQPERIIDQWNPDGDIKDLLLHPNGESIFMVGDFNYWTNYRPFATVLDQETFLSLPGQELLNGEVTDVIADGSGGWYVAGIFDIVNAKAQNGLFHLDSELNIIPGFPKVKGQVNDLKLLGDTLLVAGEFTSVGGYGRRSLAAISTTTKQVLDLDVKFNGSISKVDVWNDTLFVGGSFTAVNNFGTYGAQLNKLTGNVDTYFDCPNNTVTASAPDGNGGWFIGGTFSAIGDSTRRNLAHIGSDGIASAWKCDLGYVEGPFNSVSVLEVHNNYLYVGGEFKEIGGQSRNNTARIHIETGEVDAWEPNFYGAPSSFAFRDQTLFAGGKLGYEGNWVANGGVVNPSTAEVESLAKSINGIIHHSVSDGNGGFFIAGHFSSIGDSIRQRLAHQDGDGVVLLLNPILKFLIR